MKKIISALFLSAVGVMSFTSCADDDFNEKYVDPSKTTTVGVPQVFTAVMFKASNYMDPFYYRYYTQSQTSGRFSGVIADANSKGRWQGAGEGYYNARWQNFYDVVTQYRLLENNYKALAVEQQEANKVFYLLARTIVEHQLHEMMSLFGDVPFTGAGQMYTIGYNEAKKAAVYDDDVQLYKTILSDLKEVGDYMAGEVSTVGLSSLARQDYSVAAGDKDKWQRFVNSLRLRIALHLVNGDCSSEAKAAIAEIINNPAKYPVIESNSQNMGVANNTSNDNVNFSKSLSQALNTGSMAQVSLTFLKAMNIGADGKINAGTDPRVQALLDPNPYDEYMSYDVSKSSNELSNEADAASQRLVADGFINSNYYAKIDSVAIAGQQQYSGNANLESQWINAAEVSLSIAEAYVMGYGVSADAAKAKQYFIKGVEQSCEYYWNIKLNSSFYKEGNDSYGLNGGNRALVIPSPADYTAYAESIWNGKQECVATQLWLNFGIMNELEAWNVVRRTGYPVFDVAKDDIQASYPLPPCRLPYTSSELNNNTENCQAAIAINYKEETGYYTNLFWAKEKYYNVVR